MLPQILSLFPESWVWRNHEVLLPEWDCKQSVRHGKSGHQVHPSVKLCNHGDGHQISGGKVPAEYEDADQSVVCTPRSPFQSWWVDQDSVYGTWPDGDGLVLITTSSASLNLQMWKWRHLCTCTCATPASPHCMFPNSFFFLKLSIHQSIDFQWGSFVVHVYMWPRIAVIVTVYF